MTWGRVTGLAVAAVCGLALSTACGVEGPPEDTDNGATTPNQQGSGGSSEGETSPGEGGDPGHDTGDGAGPTEGDCPYEGPAPIDVTTLDPCPQCSAGGAHCLPSGLVPAEFKNQLDACDPDRICVPDSFIETTGKFIPATCSSVGGVEGRCLNRCIPQVADQADLLPIDICADHEVCTPCFDPLTAEDTGACTLSCDPGPVDGPQPLPKCCGGQGTCVPPSAAGAQADKLGEDNCPQDGGALLCAPDVFVSDPNWSPPSCQTGLISSLFGSEYAQGACLPECLPDVDNFLIGQDDCADGFKCAPCLEPPFGQSSGACDL
jgi:hypothetical protein